MLTIRLTRKGKKNQPFFRIVVIDKKRSAKGGRAVELVGYVNPLTKKNSLEKERILYWLGVGAKASPRVHNLLVSEKVIDAKKINVFNMKKGKIEGTTAPVSAPSVASAPSAPVIDEVAQEPTLPAQEEQSSFAKASEDKKEEQKAPESDNAA